MNYPLLLGSFVLLEGLSLLGDYFIKSASLKPQLSGWFELALGGMVYGITAIGWFFLMRELKLVTISLFSALVGLGLTCLLGVFVFREKLSGQDFLGIAFGCISISLLMRFNEG
jgi:drug/metabolite transporter (DMT)-like permease